MKIVILIAMASKLIPMALVASLFLVAMPGAPNSFLFLIVRPGAPSSVLAPRSHGLQPNTDGLLSNSLHNLSDCRVGNDALIH